MPEYKYVPKSGHILYRHLAAVPDSALFHEQSSPPLAHPADLFSEKLAEVVDSYVKLANDLKATESSTQRADLTKALISSVNEFYDQLFLVMLCLTPQELVAGQRQKDVLSLLRKLNCQALGNFNNSTRSQHQLIREMANVLKHHPSSIGLLQVVNHKNLVVQGFFIQSVVGSEDLRGPNRAIHPMYRVKVNTGISFNHLLLNLLGRLFNYMKGLDSALFNASSPIANCPLESLDRLIATAQTIETEFFPDEYQKPFAQLRTMKETKVVTFPFRYRYAPSENPDRIQSVSVHGVFNQRTSQSHQVIPYLQLTRPDSDWV